MAIEQTLQDVAFPMARFSAFAANAIVFGFVPVLTLVLRPSFAELDPEEWKDGRRRLSERLEGLMQAALIAAAVAAALVLVLQAIVISDFFGGKLGADAFRSVFETTFGKWYLARFPLILTLAIILVGKVRQNALAGAGDDRRPPSAAFWAFWSVLSLALLATTSFSGHASVASPKALSLVNDIVHLAAGATWFAGIVILAVALPDAWRGKDAVERLKLLAPVVIRFSRVALVSIMVVLVTGIISSYLHIGKIADLYETVYGRTLALKIIVFSLILLLGAVNHYVLKDRMKAGLEGAEPAQAQRLFRRTIAMELAVALTIFALTGVLTGLARTNKHTSAAPAAVTAVEVARSG